MALPGSGAISLGDIQTEFGGSNPISISEYYSADIGVPASGTISMSDFHGTSNTDVTPNSIDWGALGPGSMPSSVGTFTDINQTITVQIQPNNTVGTLQYRINGGSYTSFSVNTNISISNNDTLQFNFIDTVETGTLGFNGTLVVINTSDSNATLDTITVSTYDGF